MKRWLFMLIVVVSIIILFVSFSKKNVTRDWIIEPIVTAETVVLEEELSKTTVGNKRVVHHILMY